MDTIINLYGVALPLWFVYSIVFIFGAAVGSFLNVVADRLLRGETLSGRSHCDHCKRVIAPHDLLPIVSFFILKGRCRYCAQRLSLQYPLVELLTALLFTIFFMRAHTITPLLVFVLIITALSIAIAIADIKHHIILDELLVIMFCAGLLFHFQKLVLFVPGAIMVASWFFFIHFLSQGKAMGYGDVKLVFAMGFVLPLPYFLGALYLAFLTGGVTSLILIIIKHKKMNSPIAFGPFLLLGLLTVLWYVG